jgi:hypothetical protein
MAKLKETELIKERERHGSQKRKVKVNARITGKHYTSIMLMF